MPRSAREKSETGTYHVMLRGTNRQDIFHDDEDCIRYLDTLKKYKDKSENKVYGWCLMCNHIHLLLQEGEEGLSVIMKRVGVSYAWYYNWKYKATGHLFQDRFKSEKVETDEYLIAVIRYIHQNPVKAGMVSRPAEWKWSSCQGYYGEGCCPAGLLDKDFILGIFSENQESRTRRFIEYNETRNEDTFLDDTIRTRLTDEEAKSLINGVINRYKIAEIKGLPREQRDMIVARIKDIDGVTQRQISRILGISLSLVNRA